MECRTAARLPRLALPSIMATALAIAPAFAQETGSAARGLAYAKRHCAECHAVEADRDISPVVGIAPFKEIANTPGMTPLALRIWFQSPHPNMPLIMLAPDDRDDVVAYITSLRERK